MGDPENKVEIEMIANKFPLRSLALLSRDQQIYGATAVFLIVALAAPSFIYPVFIMKALCFALFAAAFNLLLGYAGLMSFGHAAYFGVASYTTAYTLKAFGLSPELGILAGTLAATVLGIVFGAIAIRCEGIYFAMVTLALAQMVYFVCAQVPFAGGEEGIQGVPRGVLFGLFDLSEPLTMYYFVLVVFLLGYAVIYRTIHSPFGEILRAVRENETRAISLGYKTTAFKFLAFVLSTALVGLAGATNALVFQLSSLADVDFTVSGEVLLMTLLGGLGTPFGPVVGAFIVVTMEQYLASFGSWFLVVEGIIFVICVMIFRRGIVGELTDLVRHYLPLPNA